MKNLRLAKFNPALSSLARYWEEDGFRRNDELSTLSLPPEAQSAIGAALQWAVAQLPSGFESLESVELRRVADVVTQWSEVQPDPELPEDQQPQPEPIAWSPAFVAAIVGNGAKGQAAIEISSVPGPETNGLAAIWDQLSV
jgi:hypothetical protein